MTDTPTQYTELIHRRLIDPIPTPIPGMELPPTLWLVVVPLILILGFVFIGWMYFKDSRSVGVGWAILLGLLRAGAYVILAWIFLLPGRQAVESSISHSKVVVMFDPTASMVLTKDDPPQPGVPLEKMKTRQDKVWDFLTNDKVNFFSRLESKNPITAYRFGNRLDEDYWHFEAGRNWTRAERLAFEEQQHDPAKANEPLPEPRPLQPEFLEYWLNPPVTVPAGMPARKVIAAANDWSDDDKARFKTQEELTIEGGVMTVVDEPRLARRAMRGSAVAKHTVLRGRDGALKSNLSDGTHRYDDRCRLTRFKRCETVPQKSRWIYRVRVGTDQNTGAW